MQKEFSNSVKIYYPSFDRDKLLSLLRLDLKELSSKLPLMCVALFGSYARGKHTVASDVDLLVVYADPKKENDYGLVWDILSKNITMIEPHVYSLSEFRRLVQSNGWARNIMRKESVLVLGEFPLQSGRRSLD